ncbi:hypothetical protein AM500_05995 [Bacillus sp. FJAT-18017]|nr:hypothetical protein AM500_05995 [Bacillus sp. FJAT-18017]
MRIILSVNLAVFVGEFSIETKSNLGRYIVKLSWEAVRMKSIAKRSEDRKQRIRCHEFKENKRRTFYETIFDIFLILGDGLFWIITRFFKGISKIID